MVMIAEDPQTNSRGATDSAGRNEETIQGREQAGK
jgi:hypothetical protein